MLQCAVLVVAIASMLLPAVADEPPIFDKRPFAESRKAAVDGQKWLIVKATASWCAPCKQMDKSTWRDEKVVKWLTDNAIAAVFDVDKSPELSKEFSIEAMPTVVAIKGGKEFDRIVGYKGPAQFLTWLEGIARGEKSIEAVKKKAGNRAGAGDVDVQARMELARELQQKGQPGEAADEYVWLWQHMLEHNQGMYGVRLSFMASDMERLATRDEAAKKKFTSLRDETAKALEAEKVDVDDLVDWVVLNKIVGDQAATLAWYEKVKDVPRWRPMIDRVARDLEDLFIASKRWADIGRLHRDPMRELDREHQMMKMIPKHKAPAGIDEATRKMMEEYPSRMFREKASRIYAGLLAGGREAEADTFAARARELDPSPAITIALTSTALQAGCPRAAQLRWLEAAEKQPELEALHGKVKTALEAQPDKK